MRRLLILVAAVVGVVAPTQAAPIEVLDPQDPANYVPVTLVATPLDAARIGTPVPINDWFEAIVPGTPPDTTFWLNRSNLRIQPQLRGWFFDRTTWSEAGGRLLDLRAEMHAQAITLTPSTEPFNGDMELPNGIVTRIWTVDGGTPRTVIMRAFITPEPGAASLATYAMLSFLLLKRRTRV